MRQPLCAMRAIYEQLELGGFEQVAPAIGRYFQDRADYQTNRYELTPELRERISRRWRPYIEQYGYGGKGEGGGRKAEGGRNTETSPGR